MANEGKGLLSSLRRLEQSLAIDKKIAEALKEKIDLCTAVIRDMQEVIKRKQQERGKQ